MGGVALSGPARNMVSSESRIATQVGLDVLLNGGNAIDAAVAMGLVEAVTLPRAGNLGGGGFILIRMADGRATSIDYRVQAPGQASRNMFLDPSGKLIPNESLFTHKAACIPGTVAGFSLALERYGTKPWSDLVRPAERIAREGFVVTPYFAQTLRENEKRLNAQPETRRIFLRDGRFYEAGEMLHQRELAQTLRGLVQNGPREFYQGRTTELIAEEMKQHGVPITADDLSTYRAVERPPLRGTYRGHRLITMPLPSSGGLLIVQMLNMLEGFELGRYSSSSPEAYHLLIEVMRRAFADRAEFMGDPD